MTRDGSPSSPPASLPAPSSAPWLAADARASRCPSVATRLIDDDDSRNSAPFRKNRVSSPVIANCVLAIISASRPAARWAVASPAASGIDGKSSRGSVWMRESNRSAVTLTVPADGSARRISVSGSARTIS